MTDIFISYAREDSALGHDLADDLKKRGFLVWWDRELLSSDNFYEAILSALTAAKAVIVIWTKHSVRSLFVRDEARYALVHKKLVAIKSSELDHFDIPFGFQSQHTDNISERDRIIAAVMKLGAKPAPGLLAPSLLAATSDTDMHPRVEELSIGRWTAFWRGFSLKVPAFVPHSRSTVLVTGAIAGSISISVVIIVVLFWFLFELRSRNAGSDLENHLALIAVSVPWIINLRMVKRLFQQRAFKSGWILGAFWSLLSLLFGTAIVYSMATLLGEPDIEKYEMGSKILRIVFIASPLSALVYAYTYSRKCR